MSVNDGGPKPFTTKTPKWRNLVRFQKTLALSAGASNAAEAEAAERAARRLMEQRGIDPVELPNSALYDYGNFADNALLKKLRDEWRAAHPNFYYGKPDRHGSVWRLKHKPRPRKPKPVDHHAYDGLFDDFKLSEKQP
jgi:hypothetical protein